MIFDGSNEMKTSESKLNVSWKYRLTIDRVSLFSPDSIFFNIFVLLLLWSLVDGANIALQKEMGERPSAMPLNQFLPWSHLSKRKRCERLIGSLLQHWHFWKADTRIASGFANGRAEEWERERERDRGSERTWKRIRIVKCFFQNEIAKNNINAKLLRTIQLKNNNPAQQRCSHSTWTVDSAWDLLHITFHSCSLVCFFVRTYELDMFDRHFLARLKCAIIFASVDFIVFLDSRWNIRFTLDSISILKIQKCAVGRTGAKNYCIFICA